MIESHQSTLIQIEHLVLDLHKDCDPHSKEYGILSLVLMELAILQGKEYTPKKRYGKGK